MFIFFQEITFHCIHNHTFLSAPIWNLSTTEPHAKCKNKLLSLVWHPRSLPYRLLKSCKVPLYYGKYKTTRKVFWKIVLWRVALTITLFHPHKADFRPIYCIRLSKQASDVCWDSDWPIGGNSVFERFERSATNVTRQDQKLWKLVESCFPTANTHTQTQTDRERGRERERERVADIHTRTHSLRCPEMIDSPWQLCFQESPDDITEIHALYFSQMLAQVQHTPLSVHWRNARDITYYTTKHNI